MQLSEIKNIRQALEAAERVLGIAQGMIMDVDPQEYAISDSAREDLGYLLDDIDEEINSLSEKISSLSEKLKAYKKI